MELPIFPLNGAVLYPGTSLPLNIFENRYIEMVNYALARDRLIGMIQKNEDGDLYNIGCIGKIHSFNETGDGRYLISLHGTHCFRIIEELNLNFNFRIVNSDKIENNDDDSVFSEEQRVVLLNKYKNYIKAKRIKLDLNEVEKIEMIQLMKFIAMISPFKDVDKQVLLESLNLFDFYNHLLSIIELELVGDISNSTVN